MNFNLVISTSFLIHSWPLTKLICSACRHRDWSHWKQGDQWDTTLALQEKSTGGHRGHCLFCALGLLGFSEHNSQSCSILSIWTVESSAYQPQDSIDFITYNKSTTHCSHVFPSTVERIEACLPEIQNLCAWKRPRTARNPMPPTEIVSIHTAVREMAHGYHCGKGMP